MQRRLDMVLRTDSNEKNMEGYSVISLYFDDIEDTCLTDTKEGVNERLKYRIRIYNHSLNTIKLEVKEKKNNRVLKKSKCITEEEMRKLMCGQCIEDFSKPEDPAFLFNLAIRTKGLRPKVIVAYERKAYVYDSGSVRITFDRNVRTSRETDAFGTQEACYDFLKGQDAVLEIKYDEFIPQFILQLLEANWMQQTAYSKYQLCRERYE